MGALKIKYALEIEHILRPIDVATETRFWSTVEAHTRLQSAQVSLAKYVLSTGNRFRIRDRTTGEIL